VRRRRRASPPAERIALTDDQSAGTPFSERVVGPVSLGSGTHGAGITVDGLAAVEALGATVTDVTEPA
jgi:hypothetical protein